MLRNLDWFEAWVSGAENPPCFMYHMGGWHVAALRKISAD